MKRSPIARKTPMARTSTLLAKPAKEPKPEKGPRPKKCANRACRAPYVPDPKQPWKNWCGDDCALVIALEKLAKQKAAKQRAERVADKAKRDSFKKKGDFAKDAQRAFNAFIRFRDKDLPCICCGRLDMAVDGLNTHGWDCGHYRSVGSAPFHRFNEDNAHRQLVQCNRHGAGRAVDYRVGLIARIGLERVEALECDNRPKHYDIEDLKAITATYRAKLVALKKTTY